MSGDLLDIQPQELKFIFELKKQSNCTVQLYNKSNQYVAFKIKTTSPKKYSVRPNVGIIEPKTPCDFLVTMQAQRVAPPDMICKDKFLIQSTTVPAGTTEEEITSGMFSKDDGRYVEENKLRVILASPPHSPVLSPVNGIENTFLSDDSSVKEGLVLHMVDGISPQQKVSEDVESRKALDHELVRDMQENKAVELENQDPLATAKTLDMEAEDNMEEQKSRDLSTGCSVSVDVGCNLENHDQVVGARQFDMGTAEDVVGEIVAKDVNDMKLKICELESKLKQAEVTISGLTQERLLNHRERENVQKELAQLRINRGARKVMVGFPALFVCMVALVSIVLGYLLHR